MFRTLDDTIMVAPQIGVDAVAEAKALGVRLIINNRPEGESDDQVPGDAIEAAALKAAEHLLPPGHQSLGTLLNVQHIAGGRRRQDPCLLPLGHAFHIALGARPIRKG